MKVSFNLKDSKLETSAVRIIVTHKGEVYRKYTGISVKTSRWKRTKRDGQWPTDPATAQKLKAIKLNVEGQLTDLSTMEDVREVVDRVLSGEVAHYRRADSSDRPTFDEAFREWAEGSGKYRKYREYQYKFVTKCAGGHLPDWEGVDAAFYARTRGRMEEGAYSHNTIANAFSAICVVMKAGLIAGYHKNTDFQQFRKPYEGTDAIYLSQSEVDTLWGLDLSKRPRYQKARDLFILGCYTAARFSDYSRITAENIQNGNIVFVQKKTGGRVVVPLSPRAREVLERYGWTAPYVGYNQFCKDIKEVCRLAGITEAVKVTRSRGAGRVEEVHPKYELVSSHTARRTGATLLAQTGISLKSLMLITGHKTLTSLEKYLRLTGEENANALRDNPFFA